MKGWRLPVGLAVLAAALGTREGAGCGPFLMDLEFTTYHGPTPAERAAGQIGVLRPHYYREPLVLAYRALSGLPAVAEPAAVETRSTSSPMEAWLGARRQVKGASALARIDTDKTLPGSEYQSFPNCLDGAFENAAATLRARVQQWGAADARTAEWLRGQDQVFENCAGGSKIPGPLGDGDAGAAADRRYQIAAAEFYALEFDQARADFEKIAADRASPWREMAPYLAARASLRQGTIQKDDSRLRDAVRRLGDIVNDPAQQKMHAQARRLLEFARARIEPGARLAEIGAELTKPAPENFRGLLTDYTTIWDRMEEAKRSPPVDDSELADWIVATQKGGDALAKWRQRRTLPWLVTAVMWSDPARPMPGDLASAARGVAAGSPAYATVTYYSIRNLIRLGQTDEARQWSERALAAKPSDSFANLLRSERLRMARDWGEFLRYAARKPVAEGSDDLQMEEAFEGARTGKRAAALDEDSVRPLNGEVPLALWIDATRNDALTRLVRGDIARAGWVRAVVLGDEPAAKTLAGRVSDLSPEFAKEMGAYVAEQDAAARKFAAVFLMLRAPGFEPEIRAGAGRTTPVAKSDIFRDNWWALENETHGREAVHEALNDLYPQNRPGPDGFITGEQRRAGEGERKKLAETAANGVNWLAREAIAWARSHGQDPRVPRALHLVVEATHYGPADEGTHEFSRQAFEMLHQKYPASEWTKKTKYWY